jgi:hypothetical protein
MFQSTFGEQPLAVHWYVVYDSRNGNVLHTHQFIDMDEAASPAETEAGNDRARIALQVAEQNGDAAHLRVIQAPDSFQLEPGMTCRVDVATGELVTRTDPHYSRRGFIERVRAEKERKAREGAPQRRARPTKSPATAQDKGKSTGRRSRRTTKGRKK